MNPNLIVLSIIKERKHKMDKSYQLGNAFGTLIPIRISVGIKNAQICLERLTLSAINNYILALPMD